MQFGLICKQIGQSYCAGTKWIYTLYFAYVCFHLMFYARPVFQLHSIAYLPMLEQHGDKENRNCYSNEYC